MKKIKKTDSIPEEHCYVPETTETTETPEEPKKYWERYKEKECPRCGKKHRKMRKYCSRSCGNHRIHSEEYKRFLSRQNRKFFAKPENYDIIQERQNQISFSIKKFHNPYDKNLQEMQVEDLHVAPIAPEVNDYFVIGGDVWQDSGDFGDNW